MKFQTLLLTSVLLAPLPAQAGEYQPGYSAERSCFRSEYREEYVPGTASSPGYVKSYKDRIEVPCGPPRWRTVRRHNHYRPNRHHSRSHAWVTQRNRFASRPSGRSCSAASTTTGGLLGGGLAAALSKKDAYGWAVPLGAVLGMGVASADC